jgi:MoaA/NifB/PqqE/SkfB family radical SAM enzyme
MISEICNRLASFLRAKRASSRISAAIRRGQTMLPFGPSSLNLMMADLCNSQCIMCGHDYMACGSGRILTLEKWKTICSRLDLSGLVDVIYGGGGEPFLDPDLAAIAEHTYRADPVIQHTVISNMIADKMDVAEQLIRSRVHFLVSLNAASPSSYLAVTGVDVFNKAVTHTRELVKLRRKARSGSHIAISIILMRRNIQDLVEFVRLAADMGVDEVKATYVRVYPESYRGRKGLSHSIKPEDSLFMAQEASDETIRKAEVVARGLGVKFSRPPLFSCSSSRGRDCTEPWRSLYIDPDGRLFPCAASEIHFKKKIEGGQYKSGNILEQSVADFWNNGFWQSLRKTNLRPPASVIVPECTCCGMAIDWDGVKAKRCHIMDWSASETDETRL